MSMNFGSDKFLTADVRNFVEGERRKCLSDREWKHRLRGYGYDLRSEPGCLKLLTLPHGIEVCDLPLDRPAGNQFD